MPYESGAKAVWWTGGVGLLMGVGGVGVHRCSLSVWKTLTLAWLQHDGMQGLKVACCSCVCSTVTVWCGAVWNDASCARGFLLPQMFKRTGWLA